MFPLSDSIKSPRFPFINLTIILITVYAFYLQLTSPESFTYMYAFVPSMIDFSNYSTLFPFITSIFLHGGFLHIISNMWFLWVFGDNVETHIGVIPYLFLYFVSGIIGSLSQYILMTQSDIPMLGASGAVAGVLGAYFVIFPHSQIKTLIPIFGFITFANLSAGFMLGYWFVLQLLSGAASLPGASETGGVAFFAHVGGFLAGVLFGNLYKGKVHIERKE